MFAAERGTRHDQAPGEQPCVSGMAPGCVLKGPWETTAWNLSTPSTHTVNAPQERQAAEAAHARKEARHRESAAEVATREAEARADALDLRVGALERARAVRGDGFEGLLFRENC